MEIKPIQLMLITSSAEIAAYAEDCGVGRIFVDLETYGKLERQKNLNMPFNQHDYKDVIEIKKVLKKTEVMVRINPPHLKTQDEVKKAIDVGADCIMLPYFTKVKEVEQFVKAVNGQCKTNILLETATAYARSEQIFQLPLDEIHLGLNDLRISFQLDFLFEPLANGLVDFIADKVHKRKISFGFGGIGSIAKGSDIAPDAILKEHVRLKSERVILSRAFSYQYKTVEAMLTNINLREEINLIRKVEEEAHSRTAEQTTQDFESIKNKIFNFINQRC